LVELGARAYALADSRPSPGWLAEVRDDEEFITRLELDLESQQAGDEPEASKDAAEYESLGLADGWTAVRTGASRLRAAAVNLLGRAASDRIRPASIPRVVEFLGDVFVYLHEQETAAQPIGEIVETAFREAAAERRDDDPFVVVAHSLGGIITYDLLTSNAADLHVDLLVTVGTQVGFFEELKLFRSSDPSIPGDGGPKVPMPGAVRRWINVFDYSDLLGFEVGSIIDGVSDYGYRTGSLLKAHGAYLLQPGFHQRLARRAAEAVA
jgi:pimeloyl-ACP methyl ester carboxylesterase